MHEHAFPMRWADLDSLNHVNNVVYLDYAAEARAILVDDGVIAADDTISTVSIRFVRPLLLGSRDVVVRSELTDGVLTQQITADGVAPVFAVVTVEYVDADLPSRVVPGGELPVLPVRVRRSDLDAAGAVRPAKLFELLQEVRVLNISRRLDTIAAGSVVVGTASVTHVRPITWRAEPYEATVWVSRVGRGSFDLHCQISDGATLLADSSTAMVGFDPHTQSSRPLGEAERAQLEALVPS
ncbi:thioesterase family protein [Aeromicrobium fastidiosum]|uniref:Acyl-ACP thioesterase-like C-terminal domain-containing protein n=1 Tax=Aeromicrobium fastidiosum TaxID=52699 RepID=A0A641AM30_9ACTN|nr:thioesterase family protein [Aeromicrobium fastidiosum]KAA1378328.1 hypothetical protein ESP62_008130 [Aeromicrobium fastidiosum]MBP2392726.1 acyl-CoA thioester hydrolase [Aeromicrobium fastidiosum]